MGESPGPGIEFLDGMMFVQFRERSGCQDLLSSSLDHRKFGLPATIIYTNIETKHSQKTILSGVNFMTHSTSMPSPELFFLTVNAYQQSAVLKTAIELEVFTVIGKEQLSAAEIATKCDCPERGIRILCDYLTILGFLRKENFRYSLTPDTAFFLDQGSPAYLGGAIRFLHSSTLTDAFKDLTAAVRKGGTALPEGGTVAPEHPVWGDFARAMAPLVWFPAQAIAEIVAKDGPPPRKVLDIAAGHGIFGIQIARNNPEAKIWAVDWPAVLEVAKENSRKVGVSDRYSVIPGSAFEVNFGEGYDLILLTNFLHHFDPQTCEQLLRKVRRALAPNGKLITLDFVPNEDRISPPIAASFSLMMLGSTEKGDAYTFSEFVQMFQNSGFSKNVLHPIPPAIQQVIVSSGS
jgi:ubiquinone/menaquinone biosynthesis C-methylase UbiE